MQITRAFCATIKADALAALQAVAIKHGIAISLGAGSFDPVGGTAKFPINIAVPTNGAAAGDSVEAIEFRRQAKRYALKPEDLGREFTDRGQTFKLIGMKPGGRSRKPFLIQRTDTGVVYISDAHLLLDKLHPGEPTMTEREFVRKNINPFAPEE